MSRSLPPLGLSMEFSPWNSPGQNTGVGSLSLLQGIFPTQGSKSGLPHCRQILYQLSHREAQEYWSGWPFPSPGDLLHPGMEPMSPALQADSLPAEPQGSPRILEWVAISFSRGYSQPRDRTSISGSFCIAGGFFTTKPQGKHILLYYIKLKK